MERLEELPDSRPDAEGGPQRLVGGLHCAGMRKRFGSVAALNDLTFSAVGGEVHAILGENGAGKSTFVKIIAGVVKPDGGTLTLNGEPLDLRRDHGVHPIQVAFQESTLAPDLTVAQNIWLRHAKATVVGTLSRRSLATKTNELARRIEAPIVSPSTKVRALSIAEKQIVEIMKALATDSQVLVFDEATAALPAEEARWALGLARRCAAEGRLVLFISHRIHEIREVADRVTVFRNGQAVATEAVQGTSDNRLFELMLGEAPREVYPKRLAAPSSTPALRVRDLHGGRLQGVGFELRQGEILGVGGLEGQGQRDLLLALYGMARVRGHVEIGGKSSLFRSPKAALAAGVALVPEDRRLHGLLMTKTIRENVALPNLERVSTLGVIMAARERALARRALEMLQIRATSEDQLVTALSGGNQQKVVVAKLLLGQADIILLDDFTRGIDVATKAAMFEILRELTADGRSVLFHSSDAQELIEMCDRVLVMRNGAVVAVLSERDKSEENLIRAAFGLFGGDDGAVV